MSSSCAEDFTTEPQILNNQPVLENLITTLQGNVPEFAEKMKEFLEPF